MFLFIGRVVRVKLTLHIAYKLQHETKHFTPKNKKMHVILSQFDLEKALTTVASAIAKRPTHLALANVLVKSVGNTLELSTFSLELGMTLSINVEGELDGVACVPCAYFLKVVKKLSKKDKITLELKGANLELTYGKTKMSIEGLDYNEFPELPKINARANFDIESKQLKAGLDKTLEIANACKDDYSPRFGKIFISVSDYNIEFLASDGQRAVSYSPEYSLKGSTTGSDFTIAITPEMATELKKIAAKYPDDVFTFGLPTHNQDYPWIKIGDRLTIFWRYNKEYVKPNLENLASDLTGRLQIDTAKGLMQTLDRFKALLKDKHSKVLISYSQGKLELFQEAKEIIYVTIDDTVEPVVKERREVTALKMTEWIEVNGDIADFSYEFSIEYLLGCLKGIKSNFAMYCDCVRDIPMVYLDSGDTKYVVAAIGKWR